MRFKVPFGGQRFEIGGGAFFDEVEGHLRETGGVDCVKSYRGAPDSDLQPDDPGRDRAQGRQRRRGRRRSR